jgi:exonuclease VII large subunit
MKKSKIRLQNNQISQTLSPRTAGASSKENVHMTKPQPSPTIDPAALKATQEALNNAPNGDAPGVDKIRELLFGNQMQDYDKRFSQLQDRFQQKVRDIEAESARSLQNMESSIKKQLESIASQVRHEQEQRADADKELGRVLREQMDTLEKQLGKISDQLASLPRNPGCSRRHPEAKR